MIKTKLQWLTDRKSYVTYQMAPMQMKMGDLECYFTYLKT